MDYEGLLFETKDGTATVTLNSPDKLNAISTKMRASLLKIIDDIGKDDSIKVVILTGAGRGFCAGADLSELMAGPMPEPSLFDRVKGMPRPAFFKLDKPVIAAVNGACVGAGLSLALTCDIRIASDKAKFGSAFIKLGATPDNGMSFWLTKLMGPSNALEFLLTGKIVMGAEAKQLGLVNQVVPGEELMKVAQELAAQMAQYPLMALSLTKKLVYRSMLEDIARQYDWENQAGQITMQSQANKDAMNAFAEKKPAPPKEK
jgi:2-(1,2-epoxy-1,2-dihydrophenyl)acetyl-CoA isomerase